MEQEASDLRGLGWERRRRVGGGGGGAHLRLRVGIIGVRERGRGEERKGMRGREGGTGTTPGE